jgi:hypothetical protein
MKENDVGDQGNSIENIQTKYSIENAVGGKQFQNSRRSVGFGGGGLDGEEVSGGLKKEDTDVDIDGLGVMGLGVESELLGSRPLDVSGDSGDELMEELRPSEVQSLIPLVRNKSA